MFERQASVVGPQHYPPCLLSVSAREPLLTSGSELASFRAPHCGADHQRVAFRAVSPMERPQSLPAGGEECERLRSAGLTGLLQSFATPENSKNNKASFCLCVQNHQTVIQPGFGGRSEPQLGAWSLRFCVY